MSKMDDYYKDFIKQMNYEYEKSSIKSLTKKDVENVVNSANMAILKKQTGLLRRLIAQQYSLSTTNEITGEVFLSILNMLESVNKDDLTLAKDIVYKSKLSLDHINTLVTFYWNKL